MTPSPAATESACAVAKTPADKPSQAPGTIAAFASARRASSTGGTGRLPREMPITAIEDGAALSPNCMEPPVQCSSIAG
ncbi:hypothetical protein OHS58_07320 [Amycolatopsis sp. NBC_00348]|uniref:hypothetical protein n=1 Tax=Amycolatopsis sp. NBC_00348 TaxID=2975956 RepID=UPI002E26603A